jgi:uncharacterized membrane protein
MSVTIYPSCLDAAFAGADRLRGYGSDAQWLKSAIGATRIRPAMWFAFVALACMNPAPSKIRGWLRHPMLVAIKIWHWRIFWPMATGGMLLFGSFLVYAVYDRI